MEFLQRALLTLHVVAGFSSLILFFVPAIARKGGVAHNRFGRYYVYGMWTVVVTAFLLSVFNYVNGRQGLSIFLGFLALLTARPLYYGVAVTRRKRGESKRMYRVDTVLRGLLAVSSPYLVGLGLGWWGSLSFPLLTVFGVLGGVYSWPYFWRDLRGTHAAHYNWLSEHIRQMIVTAIAAFTAFFAFGGQRLFGNLFTGYWEIALWVAPTVLGVAFTTWYRRKHGTTSG